MSLIRLHLDPYRTRRMDRNDPKTGYSQWLAQRAKASNADVSLVQQVAFNRSLDSMYKEANRNDSFYFGLSGRIQDSQRSKIPIAGEGTVEFFSIANTVSTPIAKLFPLWLPVKGLAMVGELVAREKSGL